MKKQIFSLLAGAMLIIAAGTSNATMYSFNAITSNSGQQAAVATQLSMEVTDGGSGTVLFNFKNAVGIQSSVQQIYFDDFTPAWLAYNSMIQSGGVVFGSDSVTPSNLPGGTSYNFTASYGYDADQTDQASKIQNGINNSSEYLNISFNLNNSHTFSDLIAALNEGKFLVGLHVQSIGGGTSDAFINTPGAPVPEPGTMVLLGAGLFGLAVWQRRRSNR